ncbi:hypothetical protein ABVT39_001867 [Epinephelus coioides]
MSLYSIVEFIDETHDGQFAMDIIPSCCEEETDIDDADVLPPTPPAFKPVTTFKSVSQKKSSSGATQIASSHRRDPEIAQAVGHLRRNRRKEKEKKAVCFGDGKMAAAEDSTFSKRLYAHYFEFLTEKDKKLTVGALCVGARPREQSMAKNSTSNLKKHLERVHGNHLAAKPPVASKQKKQVEDDGTSKPKQRMLDFSRPEVQMLHPGEVRRMVAEYVVEDALPARPL